MNGNKNILGFDTCDVLILFVRYSSLWFLILVEAFYPHVHNHVSVEGLVFMNTAIKLVKIPVLVSISIILTTLRKKYFVAWSAEKSIPMTSSKLIKHEPPRIASYLNQFANKTAYLEPKFCDALPLPTLFCFYQNGSPIYCIAYLKPKKKKFDRFINQQSWEKVSQLESFYYHFSKLLVSLNANFYRPTTGLAFPWTKRKSIWWILRLPVVLKPKNKKNFP